MLTFFTLLATAAISAPSLMEKTCAEVTRPGYVVQANDELPYLCALPERVKKNVPEVYWLPSDQYQTWLKRFPKKPSAQLNFGKDLKESHRKVNELVLHQHACHFYSSISPSVQAKVVTKTTPRTKIVLDFADLMDECEAFKRAAGHKCSVIEFAGHSTQSVGLDTVFGIDEQKGAHRLVTPSKEKLSDLGRCLREISEKNAVVVFSTCGGDAELATKKLRYWPGKAAAQRDLAALFGMPIVSGIGSVGGTDEGGAACDQGWHLTTL